MFRHGALTQNRAMPRFDRENVTKTLIEYHDDQKVSTLPYSVHQQRRNSRETYEHDAGSACSTRSLSARQNR